MLLVGLLVAACSDDEEWELVDTLGQRYRYTCDSEHCHVTLNGGECADGAVTGGAILEACTKSDRAIIEYNCRPVACSNDDGCRTNFDTPYACVHGLCQNKDASFPLGVDDVEVLCLADTPRQPACSPFPGDQSRIDLAVASCPGDEPLRTCPTVPAQCRQR